MYRIGLEERIGPDGVRELENIAINNRIKKWSRDELFLIRKTYSL